MTENLNRRCDRCRHFVQGFGDNELALKMRLDWCGYCTANAPAGELVPADLPDTHPLVKYKFPVVEYNWLCARFERKQSDRD